MRVSHRPAQLSLPVTCKAEEKVSDRIACTEVAEAEAEGERAPFWKDHLGRLATAGWLYVVLDWAEGAAACWTSKKGGKKGWTLAAYH